MSILLSLAMSCRSCASLGDSAFKESQKIRMKSLSHYKDAGDYLLQIRDLFHGATRTKPYVSEVGTFKSFSHFLKLKSDELLGMSRRTAYNYIKLAENWHVVLKLGMQSVDDSKVKNSMRICRTLIVIDWYNDKIKAGADADTLTLDLYWLEQNNKKDKKSKKASLPYEELVKDRDYHEQQHYYHADWHEHYKERCNYLNERCQQLEELLASKLD